MKSEKLSPQNQIFLNVFSPLYKGKEGSFEPSSHFCNIKRQQLIFVFFRKHPRRNNGYRSILPWIGNQTFSADTSEETTFLPLCLL